MKLQEGLRTGEATLSGMNQNIFIFPVIISENVPESDARVIFKKLESLYLHSIANFIVNAATGHMNKISDSIRFDEFPLIKLKEDYIGSETEKVESEIEPTKITVTFKVSPGRLGAVTQALKSLQFEAGVQKGMPGGKVSLGGAQYQNNEVTIILTGRAVPAEARIEDYKHLLQKDISSLREPMTKLTSILYKFRNYMVKKISRHPGTTIRLVTKVTKTGPSFEPFAKMTRGEVMALVLDVKDSVGMEGDISETIKTMAKDLHNLRQWADIIINDSQGQDATYCLKLYEGNCMSSSHRKTIMSQDQREKTIVIS